MADRSQGEFRLESAHDLESRSRLWNARVVAAAAGLILVSTVFGLYQTLVAPVVNPFIFGMGLGLLGLAGVAFLLRHSRPLVSAYIVLATALLVSLVPMQLIGPVSSLVIYFCIPLALSALLLPPRQFHLCAFVTIALYTADLVAFALHIFRPSYGVATYVPPELSSVVLMVSALLVLWLVTGLLAAGLRAALNRAQAQGATLLLAFQQLRDAYATAQATGQRIGTMAGQLTDMAGIHAAGSHEQVRALEQVTGSVAELTSTNQQLAEEAARAAAAMGQTQHSMAESQAAIADSARMIGELRQALAAIAQRTAALTEQAATIRTVARAIEEMAEQVHVLAIAARIEAVGAGTAGRRFAVVADEVQALSGQATAATAQIQAVVLEIDQAQAAAAVAITQGLRQMHAVEAHTVQIQDNNQAVAAHLADLAALTQLIAQASQQQEQLHRGIVTTMSGVAHVAQQVAVSSHQLADTTEQLHVVAAQLVPA